MLNPSQIYFDCNATTATLPCAAEQAMLAMQSLFGNPSSTHATGLRAKYLLEQTRKKAANVLNVEPQQIVFTSGATEGIQVSVLSALRFAAEKKAQGLLEKNIILYGATEHKAVPQALEHWNRVLGLDLNLIKIPVNHQGLHDLAFIQKHLPQCLMICTMAANNETGAISDLQGLQTCIRSTRSDILWMVDGVQALGKLDLNLKELTIDYAPFSGHKIYAPKGVGFLYVRASAPFTPLMVGGGQERGLRSGTENLPGVAALGAILDRLLQNTSDIFVEHEVLEKYRTQIATSLRAAFPNVIFNADFSVSLPTTINFSVPGLTSRELMNVFDAAGVRMSAGSACSAGKTTQSYVLDAMGVAPDLSAGAIRLSFGPATLQQEIDAGCIAIQNAARALKTGCHLIDMQHTEPAEHLREGVILFAGTGGTNTWLIVDAKTKNAVVLDVTEDVAQKIIQFVTCHHLNVLAVVDSHSHADHETARNLVTQALGMHDTNHDDLGWPLTTSTCMLQNQEHASALVLNQEKNIVFARAFTPGHTHDSHCFLLGTTQDHQLQASAVRFMFTGDTVLIGGIGRTNWPSSSISACYQSLKRMHAWVHDKTVICPAHDYFTAFFSDWSTEIKKSELLNQVMIQGISEETFEKLKQKSDALPIFEHAETGIICGAVQDHIPDMQCLVSVGNLETFNQHHANVMVIDVRDVSEFAMLEDWKSLGLPAQPRNVSLSRLSNFIAELHAYEHEQPVILCVCQSGARSLLAAKSLRRLGFDNAYSLEGGMAYGCRA